MISSVVSFSSPHLSILHAALPFWLTLKRWGRDMIVISAWAFGFLCVCWGLCLCRAPGLSLGPDGNAGRALTESVWPCWSSSLCVPRRGNPLSSRAPDCGPGPLWQPLPGDHWCGGPGRRRAPDTDSRTSLRWSEPLRKRERERENRELSDPDADGVWQSLVISTQISVR